MATDYCRKLYALLYDFYDTRLLKQLGATRDNFDKLEQWWKDNGKLLKDIASSSDRVNLRTNNTAIENTVHPISSQKQSVTNTSIPFEIKDNDSRFDPIRNEKDIEKIFWWCWRFLPEIKAKKQQDALLIPAHAVLPDCPIHSYQSTVSALMGAMYPERKKDKQEHPYLFLFTFSPVQEFIKASRKFLDFWSGSYLLHYLGAKVCWKIAKEYGADAVITPSLWSQEIIDALMVKEFDNNSSLFKESFEKYTGLDPASRFQKGDSTSLVTAGFPNVITALVPEEAAKELGKTLSDYIKEEWQKIANKVREDIKKEVIEYLKDSSKTEQIQDIINNFPEADREACKKDIEQWKQGGCWEWNQLWEAQIDNTWETYWTAVPLGHPEEHKSISRKDVEDKTYDDWKEAQQKVAPHRFTNSFPTLAEEQAYDEFNVGTWWGALQARLGQSIQSIKNTRTWQVPTAPGERSSLSGQHTALHPRLIYQERFKNGFGVSAGSLRLFWKVMAEVYPGLFNGSEKLNAIELTKRMAWNKGGVAESLGIPVEKEGVIDYDKLIRFPNLSAIASARFAKENPKKIKKYWYKLKDLVHEEFGKSKDGKELVSKFSSKTRRPFQIKQTDKELGDYNGVMFSSKWLADDMGLNTEQANTLRGLVDKAHKDCGFGDGSPADWWVIVLGDGDGMGKYVSGSKLKNYGDYINESVIDNSQIDEETWDNFCNKTRKRMGPATHVGLNRALLDFSNRLVPYLTERRFCGKVVYSGGDDVMAVLPLADLPEYLLSLRSAWCGENDPQGEFKSEGGYWHLIEEKNIKGLQQRPYFTMGEGATMSLGIVIAHKSVPLPTVLESLWTAEKERAKKLTGASWKASPPNPPSLGGNESKNSNKEKEIHSIPAKDGLCFRVIYGSGNTLEALMKGHLLEPWWEFISKCQEANIDLSPLLYRLAEDLPRHAAITPDSKLLSQAAKVICDRRNEELTEDLKEELAKWLDLWEEWAYRAQQSAGEETLGTTEADLAKLLRFSAFWVDKMTQQQNWTQEVKS